MSNAREVLKDSHLTRNRLHCPLCNGRDFRKKFVKDGFDFVSCASCGMVYVRNLLIDNVHTHDDLHGSNVPPEGTKIEHFQSYGDKYHRAKRIERLVESHFLGRKDISLLDIGCGVGYFLQFMKSRGYENVRGLDVNSKSIRYLKSIGIDADVGFVEDQVCADYQFDAIVVDQVLEHVEDPNSILKKCHRILKPGGIIWLSTPNIQSWHILWRLKQFHRHFTGSGHINHFTPRTLKSVLEKNGFRVKSLSTWIEELTLARLKAVLFHPQDFDKKYFKTQNPNREANKMSSQSNAKQRIKTFLMSIVDWPFVLLTRFFNLAAYIEICAIK